MGTRAENMVENKHLPDRIDAHPVPHRGAWGRGHHHLPAPSEKLTSWGGALSPRRHWTALLLTAPTPGSLLPPPPPSCFWPLSAMLTCHPPPSFVTFAGRLKTPQPHYLLTSVEKPRPPQTYGEQREVSGLEQVRAVVSSWAVSTGQGSLPLIELSTPGSSPAWCCYPWSYLPGGTTHCICSPPSLIPELPKACSPSLLPLPPPTVMKVKSSHT